MIAGDQARIVINIAEPYLLKVPGVLPGVETWVKEGRQWRVVVSEFRPMVNPDGSWTYEMQDTEQNRLTALIFWLRRGCKVTRILGAEADPFPKKVQDAFHKTDELEVEEDKKALEALDKEIEPLEKKLAKVSTDLLVVSSRLSKQLELVEVDKKQPNKEILGPLQNEVDRLSKSKNEMETRLKIASVERQELRLKV